MFYMLDCRPTGPSRLQRLMVNQDGVPRVDEIQNFYSQFRCRTDINLDTDRWDNSLKYGIAKITKTRETDLLTDKSNETFIFHIKDYRRTRKIAEELGIMVAKAKRKFYLTEEVIPYAHSYILNSGLIPCYPMGQISKDIEELVTSPVPPIKLATFDIETEMAGDHFYNPQTDKIHCISWDSEDYKAIWTTGQIHSYETVENSIKTGSSIVVPVCCTTETEMLERFFQFLLTVDTLVIVTFNGDLFDLPNLAARAEKLGLSHPFIKNFNSWSISNKIHIDIGKTCSLLPIKTYAMGEWKWETDSLASVCKAYLDPCMQKTHVDFNASDFQKLCEYCSNDSYITRMLLDHRDRYFFNILIMLSRISKLGLEECSRRGITGWTEQYIKFWHRQNHHTIRTDYYKLDNGVRFQFNGGIFEQLETGIHFNVQVLDFASLYPKLAKVYNISPETMNCTHPECKTHIVPGTPFWTCTHKIGFIPLLIDEIRRYRVDKVKVAAKVAKKNNDPKESNKWKGIGNALKVFINGMFGALGFSEGDNRFAFYRSCCPSSITSAGRYSITKLKTLAESPAYNFHVVSVATDAIFVKNYDRERGKRLLDHCKEDPIFDAEGNLTEEGGLGVELEEDHDYILLALSDRNNNYFGIERSEKGPKLVKKGLKVMKRDTAPYIRQVGENLFAKILSESPYIEKNQYVWMESFKKYLETYCKKYTSLKFIQKQPLESLYITKKINTISSKGATQYLQAAYAAARIKWEYMSGKEKSLYDDGYKSIVNKGTMVTFIKMRKMEVMGVTTTAFPINNHITISKTDIDWRKYQLEAINAIKQIVEPFGVDVEHREEDSLNRFMNSSSSGAVNVASGNTVEFEIKEEKGD